MHLGLRLPSAARTLLGLALLVLMVRGAAAEVLVVRSGEHNGFSRIVVAPQQKTGWTLGRVGAGYELRLERPGVTFDLSRAFDLIPKRRLSALSAGTVDSSMAFGLACDCHAVAFETAGGAIVVDLVSGPGNPASGFEARLDGPVQADAPGAEPQADANTPSASGSPITGIPPLTSSGAGPVASGYVFDPAPFWGSRAPDANGHLASGRKPDSLQGDPAVSVAETGNLEASASTEPVSSEAGNSAYSRMESSPTSTSHLAISNTERDLLFQLSRAATQGLVTPKDVLTPPTEAAAPQDVATGLPNADPPPQPDDRAAIRSQTSVDRDTMAVFENTGVRNGDGAACAPNDDVAIATWGEDTDPASQFVDARSQIVGEFDRPDEGAAVRLARLYLRFGFGAEARATLDAFDVPDDHAPLLREMSWLVDGEGDVPRRTASIAKMYGCDSDIALWAALARESVEPGDRQARAAVLRGFAALPAALRKTIGPRLAEIFFMGNDPDGARNIRNATDRASIEPERSVNLIDARLDLAAGKTSTAQEILDRLSRGDDATAQDALILGIESRLRDGKTVDPILMDAAAALARENRGTPQGSRLLRAHILALAANGNYDQALSELSDTSDIAPMEKRVVTAAIFSHITDFSSDPEYLATMSLQISRFLPAEPAPELQVRVASRLQAAGLPDLALQAMDEKTAESELGRILRARVGLDNFDPDLTLSVLAGLGGADAIALRARAYDMAGLNAEAARAFAAAGNTSDGAGAAWRAGDWARAAALGDSAMQERLKALGLGPPEKLADGLPTAGPASGAPANKPSGGVPATTGIATPSGASGDPVGPLAAAKDLIAKSQNTRSGISSLLNGLP